MRCSWLLCFYYYQTIVLFVGRTIFLKFKPMLFRWFLCFSHSKQCFFVASCFSIKNCVFVSLFHMFFDIHSTAFSLIPISFYFKYVFFFVCSYVSYGKASAFLVGSYDLLNKTCAFPWTLSKTIVEPTFVRWPLSRANIKPVFFCWP